MKGSLRRGASQGGLEGGLEKGLEGRLEKGLQGGLEKGDLEFSKRASRGLASLRRGLQGSFKNGLGASSPSQAPLQLIPDVLLNLLVQEVVLAISGGYDAVRLYY